MSEFKVDDVVQIKPSSGLEASPIFRGEDLRVTGIDGEKIWLISDDPERPMSCWMRSGSLTLVSRAGQPAEGKFYRTMPSVLPETLPAGLRWLAPQDGGVTTGPARFGDHHCRDRYVATGKNDGDDCERTKYIKPAWLDWSTVPLQPSPASGSADAAVTATNGAITPSHCGPEAGRPDPYTEHRLRHDTPGQGVGLPTEPAAPNYYSTDRELGRIAKRRRHLAQLLGEMGRKVEPRHSTHPDSWPEDSGEELRVT